MCGRFAQSMTREDFLALLTEDVQRDIPYDPEFNVAPDTKALHLSEHDELLHLDSVIWEYNWDDEVARCRKLPV